MAGWWDREAGRGRGFQEERFERREAGDGGEELGGRCRGSRRKEGCHWWRSRGMSSVLLGGFGARLSLVRSSTHELLTSRTCTSNTMYPFSEPFLPCSFSGAVLPRFLLRRARGEVVQSVAKLGKDQEVARRHDYRRKSRKGCSEETLRFSCCKEVTAID